MARDQLVNDAPGEDDGEDEVAKALAAFGLIATDPIDIEDEPFSLWPENLPIFQFWQRIQTQWRVGGMGSVTGLDYAGVQAYMAMAGVKAKDRPDLIAGLQVMERASLDEWAKKK